MSEYDYKNDKFLEYYFDEKLPKITHKPSVGDIVLFPSSLHHRTIPFTTDVD